MIYNFVFFVFYFILRVDGFCNGILRLLVKIGTRCREVVFIFEKRSISDAGKKARDLSEKVSTSEERKKGEREKKKRFAKICYAKVTSSSSVSLPFRFEKIHEVEGKKEIISASSFLRFELNGIIL